jgi:protein phosphatase
MRVHYSADTNVGLQRQVNQDKYGVSDSSQSAQRGTLLIVCDGMGGHTAGEVASSMGVDTVLSSYYGSQDTDYTAALVQAFQQANARIYAQGQGNMGTTGVAALVLGNNLYIANVGDSRAYLVRQGNIRQISQDHSFVSEQVAAGVLTPEQARRSSYRNMITRALGHRPDVQVDIFQDTLQAGDLILLMSDGLHGLVEDVEIAQVVTSMSPDDAVKRLIEWANERGGNDNITVVVARIEELEATAADTSGSGKTTQPITQVVRENPSSNAEEAVTRQLDMESDTNPETAPTEKLSPPASAVAGTASAEEASSVRSQIRAAKGGRGWILSLLVALAVLAGGGVLYVYGVGAFDQSDLPSQPTATPTATVTPAMTPDTTTTPTILPTPGPRSTGSPTVTTAPANEPVQPISPPRTPEARENANPPINTP